MMKTIIFLVAILIARPLYAGSFYLNDAAGLTGPFPCDEQMHQTTWWNTTGQAVRFTSAVTWIGVLRKGVGDVWVFVDRASDMAPFTFVSWDHYAAPTGLHQFSEQFNPPFQVGPGDGLVLSYFCQAGVREAQIIVKLQHQD